MWYVYLLQSQKDKRWYTGISNDLQKRFLQHQRGLSTWTKNRGPFKVIYYEASENEEDARSREKYLKSGMGKRYLKNRLNRFLSLTGMILLRWFITTLAVFALPYFVSGISVDNILTAVVVAACLVFLNMVVKPVITLLTLPINILTLGLFSLVINGLFFWLVAKIITGITVDSFQAAFIGALVIAIVNWIVSRFVKHDD